MFEQLLPVLPEIVQPPIGEAEPLEHTARGVAQDDANHVEPVLAEPRQLHRPEISPRHLPLHVGHVGQRPDQVLQVLVLELLSLLEQLLPLGFGGQQVPKLQFDQPTSGISAIEV